MSVGNLSVREILGKNHHVFLKKQSHAGIHVVMWGKDHVIVDFEAPPLLNLPIPRLHFRDLRLLLPPVMCIQFVLGQQFKDAGKLSVVHVDMESEVNLVSGKLLPPPGKTPHKKVTTREYPVSFGQYAPIPIDAKVSLTLRSRDDAVKPACFSFDAYVISHRRVEHFPWSRLILGRHFIEDYAVGLHGNADKGQLFFEDDFRSYYGQSYQRKTGKS